jgi:colicin import membrane protein
MARKLKNLSDIPGLFDLAIAAPSMKAALEAWGAHSNLFHQDIAKQSEHPENIPATMSKPGVILRHPVGSLGQFTEHAHLPTDLFGDKASDELDERLAKRKKRPVRSIDEKRLAKPLWPSRKRSGSVRAHAAGNSPDKGARAASAGDQQRASCAR